MSSAVAVFHKLQYIFAIMVLNVSAAALVWQVVHPVVPPTVYASEILQPSPTSPLLPITVISGRPTRVVISSLGIDLKINEGIYDAKSHTWSLSDSDAQYAEVTPLINDGAGNTLVYGHNSQQVFGKLPNIKVGDTATVYTDNNHIFIYSFIEANDVPPKDLSVFGHSAFPLLTIQTCSGNWNETRRMSTFKLVSVI